MSAGCRHCAMRTSFSTHTIDFAEVADCTATGQGTCLMYSRFLPPLARIFERRTMFKFHAFLAPIAVVCVACGASFTANDGSGTTGGAGHAGEASGGLPSSAGGSGVGDA